MKIFKVSIFIAALFCATPVFAGPFFAENEPNNSFNEAQFIETDLGKTYQSVFIDGFVEGSGEGLFDFFAFNIAPLSNGLTGGVFASGYNAADQSFGDSPWLVLFDGSGKQIDGTAFSTAGRYIVGVGREDGKSTSSYRLTVTVLPVVPEPSTWALMLAGFGMISYAMRRSRAAFA